MSPPIDGSENRSLADAAYEVLRLAILRCDLAPGEQVTESQLGDHFGIGRAAVRAALTRLSHERLVQAFPRHGYVIAPVTLKHVHELFGVRMIIEPAAARLAAERADEELTMRLDQLNEVRVHDSADEALASLRQANKAFHVAVVRAAGNERLAETAIAVLDELDRVLYLPILARIWDRVDATIEEHRRIISALRVRDGQAAAQAAYDHILPNRQFVIDVLISSPGLRSINLVAV